MDVGQVAHPRADQLTAGRPGPHRGQPVAGPQWQPGDTADEVGGGDPGQEPAGRQQPAAGPGLPGRPPPRPPGRTPVYKLFLCLRYLRTRYLAFVCIVSVTLGVATLIVVNSVMSGFSEKLKTRLHGVLADVLLETEHSEGFEEHPD